MTITNNDILGPRPNNFTTFITDTCYGRVVTLCATRSFINNNELLPLQWFVTLDTGKVLLVPVLIHRMRIFRNVYQLETIKKTKQNKVLLLWRRTKLFNN